MPVNERLDEFASVELVVAVCVVHLEVVELQLLLRHVGRVDWNVHVFLHVPRSNSFYHFFVGETLNCFTVCSLFKIINNSVLRQLV